MTKGKHKYYDDPVWNAAFERCIDVLAELIEKYGDRVLNAIGGNHSSGVIDDYPIFSGGEFIMYEFNYRTDAENLKAYSKLTGLKRNLKKSA
ncbi:MAG: hypothetical protein J6N70_05205 [Oribacterium sp.]|nr:hypothetical protein [Oribacterium sp.]